MLTEAQKLRIKLYSPSERANVKAKRRQSDAREVAAGRAEELQERNRALPPASAFVFLDSEKALTWNEEAVQRPRDKADSPVACSNKCSHHLIGL